MAQPKWHKDGWPPERDEELRAHIAAGLTRTATAKCMGVTKSSVNHRVSRLGIYPKHGNWTPAMDQILRGMLESGSAYKAIAQTMDQSEYRVQNRAARLGLSTYAGTINRAARALATTGKKRCAECKRTFPLTEEYFCHTTQRAKNRPDRPKFMSYCRECSKIKERYYYNGSFDFFLKAKLRAAHQRAQHKGWEFDITFDFLKEQWERQQGRCYYSGKAMDFKARSIRANSYGVSIDRQDSLRGYTQDNVVLCCDVLNVMKSTLTPAQLYDWCLAVVETTQAHPQP